jgi:hypothetical protein
MSQANRATRTVLEVRRALDQMDDRSVHCFPGRRVGALRWILQVIGFSLDFTRSENFSVKDFGYCEKRNFVPGA